MIRTPTVVALAAIAFAAAACSKPAENTGASASNTEAASADTSTNTTDGATAKTSDAVSVTQDATAAAVGAVSAATVGSLSASAFVDNAAQSDMYEVEAAKLALQRSKSARVKAFAREMIAAHDKTSAGLRSIVDKGDAGDARLPSALDNRRQGMLDNLKSASDDDFDARYVDQQQAAHKEAEILMGGYAKAGQNPRLKSFAGATSPKVTAHYNMVKALDKSNADHDNKPDDHDGKPADHSKPGAHDGKPGDGGRTAGADHHGNMTDQRHDGR